VKSVIYCKLHKVTVDLQYMVPMLLYTVEIRDGKEPSWLGFCSVRVLPNIKVRFGSVRVLCSYKK